MPDDDVNEVDLEQQNVGPGGQAGGGEWPDPDAPTTGPASGESSRSDGPADPKPASGTGDEARTDVGPVGFKEVLDADPVTGGSGSTPHDDIPEDRQSSPDPSAGGP